MNNIATITDMFRLSGHYTVTVCDESKGQKELGALQRFLSLKKMPVNKEQQMSHWVEYKKLLKRYYKKALVSIHEFDNLLPTVGRSVIAQRLANVTTYTGIVNYAAVGSSTTPAANGDTQLGTETYRQTLSSQTYINNITYLSCFIAAGSATGTHNEAGLFIDGAAGANTGQIFSHVNFSPAVVKGSLNSLTLDISLTVA